MRSVVPDTQHAGRVGVAEARREANAFYCQATLFLLTLVNSYTDVITLTRWQCFGSMMTGNTLYIGWAWHNPYVAEIQTVTGATWKDTHQYQRIYPGLYYVLIIAAFLLGVVLHRHAEKRCPSYAAGVVATPLALLMGASELLLCFGVVQPKGQQRLYYLGILCVAPIFGVMWCSLTLSLTPSLPPSDASRLFTAGVEKFSLPLHSRRHCMSRSACSQKKLGAEPTFQTGKLIGMAQLVVDWRSKQTLSFDERVLMMATLGTTLGVVSPPAQAWREADRVAPHIVP